MVEKLEKFWTPINVVLVAIIIINLFTGTFVLVKYFSTFVWLEGYTNALVALLTLLWLSKLHKVLSFDTTMAENYAFAKFGNDEQNQEGLALQDTLKRKEAEKEAEKDAQKDDIKTDSNLVNPLSKWAPYAGIDQPSLDPCGYIEALIKDGFYSEATKCLNEALTCGAIEKAKGDLLWEEIKEHQK